MKVLKFLACAGLTMAAWPAAAADLGSAPPLTMPASQGQTMFEVGSNWYIRGDLGVSFDEAPTVSLSSISTPPPGLVATPFTTPAGTNWSTTTFTGGVGAGYRFNDYLRLDATWDYRTGVGGTRNTAARLPLSLDDWNRRSDDRPTRGQPLQYLKRLQRDDESQAVQQRLPRQRLCRSRNLRRLHPLGRRRPWP